MLQHLRIFVLFVVLMVCLYIGNGQSTSASERIRYGDFFYTVENEKVTIVSYSLSAGGDIIIPSEINGMPVTTIGDRAFSNLNVAVRDSVVIPDSVTTIGNSAFLYNGLLKVTIGKGVKSIGENAFKMNELTTLDIPENVEFIGKSAFTQNKLTGHLVIPNNVKTIEAAAFSNNKLQKVTIGTGIEYIHYSVFSTNQLTNVVIPNTVKGIEPNAFGNNLLKEVSIPNSVQFIGGSAFTNNQLTNITIPNSIQRIEDRTFYNNRLQKVVIPNNIKFIGKDAFWNNPLKEVTFGNGLEFVEGEYQFQDPILRVPSDFNFKAYPMEGFRLQHLIWGNDRDLKLTINQVSDKSTTVTGTTKPNADILLLYNNVREVETKANSKGTYTIKIPKQKVGDKIKVFGVDAKNLKANTKTTVVVDKTPPTKPTVRKVSSVATKVTGTTEKNAIVYVYKGKTRLGSAKAKSTGTFSVNIKKQKKGTKLTVFVRDSALNKSKVTIIKVGK